MKKIPTLAVVAAAFAVAVVPLAAQSRVELQMAAELRILQEQQAQMALTLAQSVAQLSEAIKGLNSRLDAANQFTTKGFADQDTRAKDMAQEIRAIREGTQDTNTRLGQVRDEVEAMRNSLTSLPSLLTQLAPRAPDPADPTAAPSAGAAVPPAAGAALPPVVQIPPPAPATSTLGLSPSRMFQTALADYHAGQYSIAITGFEGFLRAFPRVELSDDAHLYIGEAHAAEKRFDQAITAYNQAIVFPGTDQAPMAYYRRGMAHDALGQIELARASWEQVIKLQPNSPEAGLAKQALDRIARRQPPPPARAQ